MGTFKMAWRNVWRNQRRTGVTVAAMTLALLVLILYSGLVTGFVRSSERNLLDLELGEMQIHAEGYRKSPSIYTQIKDEQELLAKLRAAGFRASARLLGAGLAAAGEASAGVSFIGVEVKQDAVVSRIYENVREGQWLDLTDPKGVVIGRRLARNLGVQVGEEIVVLSQGADGSMANELFVVRGILRGITESVDRGGLFLNARAFRDLMVLPGGMHQIIVRKPHDLELGEAVLRVQELAPNHDVKSWRQLVPTLASVMESASGAIYVMFFIVYIAIGIVILNAMLMAVFERIREFGVLKAIGVSPGGVLRLILLESAIQAFLGIALGVGLSVPGLWWLSTKGIDMGKLGGVSLHGIAWDPIWRAEVSPNTFVGPIATLLIVVLAAAIYPALKAALLSPVKAIHHR